MTTALLVASALAALNVLLLAVLAAVWLRNYRAFKTTLVLGLLAFALVLLLENLLALYFFFDMRMLYAADPAVHGAVAALRGLQFVAIASLAASTLR
jgi:hypothetical protein